MKTDSKLYRTLLIHSILTYVLAFMINTFIHEGGHALMAKVTGLHPVLHHNYVSTSGEDNATLLVKILTPAAGPFISLIQGLLFLYLLRISDRKSLITLFFLWMSVFGFINIGGYLMMTPLADYGDTGRVFALLNTPLWLKWVIALGGIAALIPLILNFSHDFEKQIPDTLPDDNVNPGRIANVLIAYPIYAGVAISTLISLPVPTFLSLLYPLTSPFIVFMAYGRLRRRNTGLSVVARYPDNVSIILLILTMIAFILTRILVKGIAI